MELFYCDTCGVRISSVELGGETLKVDGKTYCPKCKPVTQPVEAVPVQARRPTSGRLQRQASVSPPVEPPPPAAPPGISPKIKVAAALAGCVALAVTLFIVMRPRAEATPPAANTTGTVTERANPAPAAAPTPVSGAATPKTAPAHAESGELPAPVAKAEDDVASKAFDAAHAEMAALDAADKEGQARILNAFIEKYSETLQGARARVELARLKDPKPAAKPVAVKAPASVEKIPESFKLLLDPAAVMAGLTGAVVAEKPPDGAHDGALQVKNSEKWPTNAGMDVSFKNFPAGSVQLTRKALFVFPPNAKIRFRYYAEPKTHALDVAVGEHTSAGWTGYAWRLDKPVTGVWTVQEVPIDQLKTDKKKTLEPGVICETLRLGLHGPNNHKFYIDELEVIGDPGAGGGSGGR